MFLYIIYATTREPWKTESLLWTPKLQSIRHAYSACCSMVARHGASISDRRDASALLIFTLWDWITNAIVLIHAQLPNLYALLQQCWFCWLGHVHHMPDRRILKALLYRQLVTEMTAWGWPRLHFKDICKRDIDIKRLEDIANNNSRLKHDLH